MIVAQTNLQLFRQLDAAGWSNHDRQRVIDAYALIAELHAGQYRASGKTFVAHLCGTASIVQATGGTVDQTLAALLHAAYDQGDFGDGRRVRTSRKQAEVREAIGPDAEALVVQYSDWPWRTRLPALLDGRPDVFADWERTVAFVRLANEVEERVDGADDYAPEHAAIVFPLGDVARCARRLGWEALAAFTEAIADANPTDVTPAALRTTTLASGTVVPRSMSTRLWVRGTGEQSLLRRAVRLAPGARRVVYSWRRWRPE